MVSFARLLAVVVTLSSPSGGSLLSTKTVANPFTATSLSQVSQAQGEHPFTCPLTTPVMPHAGVSSARGTASRNCLVEASSLPPKARLVDVRSAAEFQVFHAESAENISATTLLTFRPNQTLPMVVYDNSHLPQDAIELCMRLRSAGISDAFAVNGGAAALARRAHSEQALPLSRLNDGEVIALLSGRQGKVEATPIFLSHPALQGYLQARRRIGTADTLILLVDSARDHASLTAIASKRQHKAFYWDGTPDRLWNLIETKRMSDAKVDRGPAAPNKCSAI